MLGLGVIKKLSRSSPVRKRDCPVLDRRVTKRLPITGSGMEIIILYSPIQ